MTGSFRSVLRRLRRVIAFVRISRSPAQWLPLALLGWARDNPASLAARWFPAIGVRPALLHGSGLTIKTQDLGQLVSFEEVFVESVYELDLVPFTPTAIFDCGAHVGYFAALAASAYPRVPLTVFEPNPANVEWLRRNLSAFADHTAIRAAAVSVSDRMGRFAASASNAGRLQEPGAAGVDVPVLDLAAFVPRAPEATLLIKMDVEGEERQLIPHLLPVLPHQCALFLETHDGVAAREELVRELSRHDFRVSCRRERPPYADLFAVRGGG